MVEYITKVHEECLACKSRDKCHRIDNGEEPNGVELCLWGNVIRNDKVCAKLKTDSKGASTIRKVYVELNNCKECEFAEIWAGRAERCGNPAFDELKHIEEDEGIPNWCPRILKKGE